MKKGKKVKKQQHPLELVVYKYLTHLNNMMTEQKKDERYTVNIISKEKTLYTRVKGEEDKPVKAIVGVIEMHVENKKEKKLLFRAEVLIKDVYERLNTYLWKGKLYDILMGQAFMTLGVSAYAALKADEAEQEEQQTKRSRQL